MHGCPNRCRHCYLGQGSDGRLTEQDVRRGAQEFRDFLQDRTTAVRELCISTWFRDPDFSDDYRHLYELERELSDGQPPRDELLSIWRLARDRSYAEWAKSLGPDSCQISFFGMEKTTDWFHRRRGAFNDALTATERLLEVGMKPRWQIFLTTKLIPELEELLCLVGDLKLRERFESLDSEFQLFMHPPGPDHEARNIEHLRPTIEDVTCLPVEIMEASRKHFGREILWQPEGELCEAILKEGNEPLDAETVLPEVLWIFVTSTWNVFSNIGTLEEWWKLGNLKEDSVESIIRRFEGDEVVGLQTLLHYTPRKLAEEYGDLNGRQVYSDEDNLLSLYRARHCERTRDG